MVSVLASQREASPLYILCIRALVFSGQSGFLWPYDRPVEVSFQRLPIETRLRQPLTPWGSEIGGRIEIVMIQEKMGKKMIEFVT